MKIVHISYTYGQTRGGGAALAASRLHEALIDAGYESHFVCLLKHGDGRNVHVLPQRGLLGAVYLLFSKLLRAGWKLTPFKRVLGTNLLPLPGLRRLIGAIKPDIVHLHWLNFGVASQESLQKLPCPIVVNLHDLWPIDSLNFYPGPDRRLVDGYTKNNSNWVERWMIHRKRKFSQSHPVSFIGPSKWVVDMCRRSVVGRGLLASAIPNVINPVFQYDSNLSTENKSCVFLFGCDGGVRNPDKGFDDLCRALRELGMEEKRCVELHVFGQKDGPPVVEGVRTVYEGYVADPMRLRRVYHASDVFVFPSRQETQGMAKIEAMLCGLPVIAFDRTACAEGIVSGETGWIVADGDFSAFAQAIRRAIELWRHKAGPFADRAAVAVKAREMYSPDAVVKAVVDHYSKSIAIGIG